VLLFLGSQSRFKTTSYVVIILDKLIERDDERYLKGGSVVGSPLEFGGF
jgi:hypothetical protein